MIWNVLISEKNIRSAFENDPHITFWQGLEVIGIEEDADFVTISFKDGQGKQGTSKVTRLKACLNCSGEIPGRRRRKNGVRSKEFSGGKGRQTARFGKVLSQ
jgi:hypothetical protein